MFHSDIMREVYNTIWEETMLSQLRRDFKKSQILPAYYTQGIYSIRIVSKNDVELAVLDAFLKARLTQFCRKRPVRLAADENILKEEDKFTKEYRILV